MIKLSELVKDLSKVDIADVCSDWTWLISEQKEVLLISIFGDIFFLGSSDEVNRLRTGDGKLIRVADSRKHFEELLNDRSVVDDFLMLDIYQTLADRKIHLKDNEVFSFKTMPLLGGDYTADNFEPTDISVHFSMMGQIAQQVQDVPNNGHIKVEAKPSRPWWKLW